MTREDVIALMENSKSVDEWLDNIDTVKAAFSGKYPEFWIDAIEKTGIASRTAERWYQESLKHRKAAA